MTWLRRWSLLVAMVAMVAAPATTAQAEEPRRGRRQPAADLVPAPTPVEPSVGELQQAALERARLQPERMLALERRLRWSALLPQLRLRVGRGTGQLQTVTDYAGNSRLVVGDQNAWQFDVGATWNLDRLLFHPDEPRLAREAERAAAHRERLLREIAELHAERQRLRQALSLAPPASALEAAEAHLRIDELTALLDALTGLGSAAPLADHAPGDRSGVWSPAHGAPKLGPATARRSFDNAEAE